VCSSDLTPCSIRHRSVRHGRAAKPRRERVHAGIGAQPETRAAASSSCDLDPTLILYSFLGLREEGYENATMQDIAGCPRATEVRVVDAGNDHPVSRFGADGKLSRRGLKTRPQMFHLCARVHVLPRVLGSRRREKPKDLG
jgi:hypothetical protein